MTDALHSATVELSRRRSSAIEAACRDLVGTGMDLAVVEGPATSVREGDAWVVRVSMTLHPVPAGATFPPGTTTVYLVSRLTPEQLQQAVQNPEVG